MELIEISPTPEYMWERHALRLGYGGRSLDIAMGMRTGGEVHWWEACRLVVLEETPECTVIEMGGAIERHHMTFDDMQKYPGYTNPWLHKHNWLNGYLYARLHANGVCEIFAHHINCKQVDGGLTLEDVVPVIGFKTGASTEEIAKLCGPLDGTRERIELGGARFDISEAARLARPEQPGNISHEGGFVVWQPYLGVDVFGGLCPNELQQDPFLAHAEKPVFPSGMARTIRFSLSLSDRSPRIARYLAPAWWYGACEEFLPEPLLPVSNDYDASLDASRKAIQDNIVRGGFEDGSVPRHRASFKELKGRVRNEPGWEGEMPYAQFLAAWRTGDTEDYAAALRSAYHFTDIAIDHAAKLVRMHGYVLGAFALPMSRLQGTIAAYLETGDPYLLNIAQAATANAHWLNKNSWPRFAVGRDGCYVRSAVLLYRYFADDFYRSMALEGAMTVARSQRPNGSFGDQGGGTGVHQWGGYITKPWMGLLALNGVLDYLELFPNVEPLRQTVKKFADWLFAERWKHESGMVTWSYQHDYNGLRRHYEMYSRKWVELPSKDRWHQETLARLLGWSSLTFGDPKYFDAWAESYIPLTTEIHDHANTAALQFLPWLQAKLWNARLTGKGIEARPVHFGPRTPATAKILTPKGLVPVKWDKKGKAQAPKSVKIVSAKKT